MAESEENKISDRIDPVKIQETVEALFAANKHWRNKLQGEDKMKLFDDHEMFEIQLNVWKIIKGEKTKTFAISLPHNVYKSDRDAALFVKDIPRTKGEMCIHHYQNILSEKGVTGISEIIPLQTFMKEYKPYEAKRKLAKSYDVFLADARISTILTNTLGKEFFRRNKSPFFVQIHKQNLKDEVSKIIKSVHMNLSHKGGCSSVNIAHTGMSVEQVVQNVRSAISTIVDRVSGEWENIRAIHLRTRKSLALPLYTDLLREKWDVEKIVAPKISNEDIDNLETQMVLEKKEGIKAIRKRKGLHPDEPLKKKRYRTPAMKHKRGAKPTRKFRRSRAMMKS